LVDRTSQLIYLLATVSKKGSVLAPVQDLWRSHLSRSHAINIGNSQKPKACSEKLRDFDASQGDASQSDASQGDAVNLTYQNGTIANKFL